jgi:hypothetical protein
MACGGSRGRVYKYNVDIVGTVPGDARLRGPEPSGSDRARSCRPIMAQIDHLLHRQHQPLHASPYSSPYAAAPYASPYASPYAAPYASPYAANDASPYPSSMPPPTHRHPAPVIDQSASSSSTTTTSASRKRKLSSRHSARRESSPASRQPSISDLFTSQQKASVEVDGPKEPPVSKRLKSDHPPATILREYTPPKTMSTAEMYNFPPKSPKAPTFIDLTSTADSSPKARKANGCHTAKGVSAGHGGAKKLVVKNLKAPAKANTKDYLEQVWKKLDGALDHVFAEGKVTSPMQELYHGVENVCRQGHASTVYSRLKDRLKKHVNGALREGLLEEVGKESVDILRAVLASYAQWTKQMVSSASEELFLNPSNRLMNR